MSETRSAAIDLVRRHIADGHYAGAALVASQRGRIIFEHYEGMAAPGLPSSPGVLWPLASISKMYAAAAILALVERGAFTLDLRVVDVFPQFTGGGKEEMRLRHLLTHTGGMIYESPHMERLLIAKAPLAALIDEMMAAPLRFRPGTSVAYADYHTLLAGHVAAAVTGEAFDALVRKTVIEPMGLADTFFPTPAEQDHRTAVVRGPLGDGTDGAMYNSRHGRGLAHPAFAVTASARDLARFFSHFAPGGPRVLSEAMVRAATRNQTRLTQFGSFPGILGYEQEGPRPWGYGFALQTPATPGIISDLASNRAFGHGGASGCEAFVDPEHDLTIAVITNTHLRTGFEAWFVRLQSICNAMIADLA